MRRFLIAFALLAACQITAPKGADVAVLPDDQISVTSLDAAPTATPAAPRPEPRPDTADQAPATPEPDISVTEEPEAPKSAEQVLCERSGGQWAMAGETGAYTCVKPTRDSGKFCTKKGDCQGMCLARSGTCAPFMPLLGCNEVLEKDGRRVTLCID